MEDLTIEKINIMAGTYEKLVEQNRNLQKENRMLKQQLEKISNLPAEKEISRIKRKRID